MDLTSDDPFWFCRDGVIHTYPVLERDLRCEVAVMGAGITGAIVAHRLAKMGMSVVVVDRRDACRGSTAASTALLQYEIDVPLCQLTEKIGPDVARRAYRLSYSSIDSLEQLAASLQTDCHFQRKTSLYVAYEEAKAKLLAREAAARLDCGFDIRLLDARQLRDEFNLVGTAAIISSQAASCDPYRFAHGLLAASQAYGALIFDRTQVDDFTCHSLGVRLRTKPGPTIEAKRVVIATGYEAQAMLREKVVNLNSTYALVTQPLDLIEPWNHQWIMWQAKDPYLYLRTTADSRLLVGGEDDEFQDADKRDASIPKKSERLIRQARYLLGREDLTVDRSWAGTFGETRDGLAYIGQSPEYPNCHFALGFGGNGITFSTIAADLLADQFTDGIRTDIALFRFGR